MLWIVPIDTVPKLKTWVFGSEPGFRVCLTNGSKMDKPSTIAAHDELIFTWAQMRSRFHV